MIRKLSITIFLLGAVWNAAIAQEARLSDHNTIGWLSYVGDIKLQPKLSLHTEAQWRRVKGLAERQQLLLRSALMYQVHPQISLNAGYAFIETYPYGDYPAAFTFPEHRLFEQVVIKNPVGKINLSHRFTLEQRFLGAVSMVNNQKEIDYNFLNRFRYRVRGEVPLKNRNDNSPLLSLILQDEVFIGWGKNVGANVFDQNRMAVLAGLRLSPSVKIETGYINQFVQQGRRVNQQPVFQYNHGFIVAGVFNIDLAKKTISD